MTLHVQIEKVDPDQMIEHLTYCCYSYNRRISPEITPAQWERVFGSTTPAMEVKFQNEENALRIARNARQTEELRAGEDNESTVELDGSDDGSGIEPHLR